MVFFGQPVVHSQDLWNLLVLMLAGLAFALAGGCPGRQLFYSSVLLHQRSALDSKAWKDGCCQTSTL